MSGARKLPSLNKQIIHEKKERSKDGKSFVYESHGGTYTKKTPVKCDEY